MFLSTSQALNMAFTKRATLVQSVSTPLFTASHKDIPLISILAAEPLAAHSAVQL